jgi:phosphoribosyl-AMP cyclohydrolase
MFEEINFDGSGLVPAVIQDDETGDVLTLCYMNREALMKTVETGKVHVFRRSKGRLMMKGETSGCIQKVKSISADCENNSVLVRVEQAGVACHTGEWSCFFKKIWGENT